MLLANSTSHGAYAMKLKHPYLIGIAGLTWLAMGLYLLPLGLSLLNQTLIEPFPGPLASTLTAFMQHRDYAVIAMIAAGLFIGYYKGKFVLRKAAKREATRISTLPNPAPLSHLYSRRFYILVAVMMGLGISLRFFGVPNDIRGLVDVAVGAALIQGGITYFRCLSSCPQT